MRQAINCFFPFNGCGGGLQALRQNGRPTGKVYVAEIDRYADAVNRYHFPDAINLGDIQNIKASDFDVPIDLIVGGSPCQGFSFAGKQLNFDDPRSKLFWEFVRLIKELKPKYFLLENVRMAKRSMDVITEALGVEPIAIQSNLVSAQSRYRNYWTNIPHVTVPDDRGILLKDVLEDYYADRDKSHCIDANYFKGGNLKSYFEKHRRQLVFSKEGLAHVADADLNGHDVLKRVYSPEGKAPTLNTMGGGNREPKVIVGGAMRGRYVEGSSGATEQRIELRNDAKSNAVTTVTKDSLVTMYQEPRGKNKGGVTERDKSPTLTSNSWEHNNKVMTSEIRAKSKTVRSGGRGSYDRHEWDSVDKLHWRKLTVKECERLQTMPDDYTQFGIFQGETEPKKISNTQRYKMLGNGFTVAVIAHILGHMRIDYYIKNGRSE